MTKHRSKHRPVKPRRAKNGRFAGKPDKGATLSEMVDYNSITPATEAPRELAADLDARERCTPAEHAEYDAPPKKRHWLIRAWRWLAGAYP